MECSKKVVIIGLDGVNKTTAKMVGVNTELHEFISTIPPYTPPSWTSILTGVNPAKHGIIGWQRLNRKTNKVNLTTSRDVMYPRISEILAKTNLRSILVNLPMTYPFEGIKRRDKTVIVSDWAAPEQAIFPESLEKKYQEYLVDPPHEWAKLNKKEYPKRVKEYTETRLGMYYDLLERRDWNFYFIVFSETDWFSHLFPQILENKDTHIVAPTFKLINEFIETAKSLADALFIVSDHGFEVKNKVFYVNGALAEGGFIKYKMTKAKLVSFVKKTVPDSLLKKMVSKTKKSVSALSYMAHDAEAFMIEPDAWGIYVSNKEEIPRVKALLSSYDEVFDVIEFKRIHRGHYSDRMPDLFVIPQHGIQFSHELNGKLSEEIYRGDHELHGVFSAYGDQIKEDIDFKKSPRVYDISPTILHLFGIPIPRDIDGRVLEEIFKEGSRYRTESPKYSFPLMRNSNLFKHLSGDTKDE